jgi:hypothetical protein
MLAKRLPPTARRTQRNLASLLAFVTACLATVSISRFLWLRPAGQLASGYFENRDVKPQIVTEGFDGRPWDWELILRDATHLWMSPGKPILIPLDTATDLRVTVPGAARAPYLVFGATAPFPGQRALLLSNVRTLDVAPNGLVLAPWNPELPWLSDFDRLVAIATSCAAAPTDKVHVATRADHVTVDYGRCRAAFPLDADIAVLGLLPGPDALLAESDWKVDHVVESKALFFISLLGAISAAFLVFGFGPALGLVFGVLPLLAAFVSPFAAILVWAATSAAGLLYCSTRFARWVWTRHRRLGALLAGAAAILGVLLWRQRSPDVPPKADLDTAATTELRPSAVVVGYSAIARGALREGTDGLPEHLARSAATHLRVVSQVGYSGGTFPLIEAYVCDQLEGMRKGSMVLFFGGTNDDWIAGLRMSRLAPLRMLLLEIWLKSDVHRYERRELVDARASLAVLPRQEQVVTHGVQCARARGYRFIFLHDFLVTDLGRDLPAARRQMRDARARAVRGAGGEFVDLFDELHDRFAVTWFNDIIHPSSVGYAHITAYIDDYLMQTQIGRAGNEP